MQYVRQNPIIDWERCSFSDLDIEEGHFSILVTFPEDLMRYFKNLGRKFYAQGDLEQDVDETEEGTWKGQGYLYPTKVKLVNPDGFGVQLYEIEKRKLIKEIFDYFNARRDIGNLV